MSDTKTAPHPAPGHWSPATAPYPTARRSDASKTYRSAKNGEVTVPEPYDWLELPPSQSANTAAWTQAQAAYTTAFLEGCPDKDLLRERLQANWDYTRTSAPSLKDDGRYYYTYNAGLAPQSQIYRATRAQIDDAQKRGTNEPVGELFFDTNLLSPDGTVALTLTAFSPSGKLLAYGLSKSGSDWFKIFVRSVDKPLAQGVDGDMPEGGTDRLPDVLDHVKFSSVAWTHDETGFFYQRYPAVEEDDKGTETDMSQDAALYYHRLGTPQGEDELVIARDAALPSSMWLADVTDDGQWLVVGNAKDSDTKLRYYCAPLPHGAAQMPLRWIPVASKFKFAADVLANDGGRFYVLTNKDAPNYRIARFDVRAGDAQPTDHVTHLSGGVSDFADVVPEDPDAVLTSATVIDGNKLLLVYSRDVKDELWLYDLPTGQQIERLLPDHVGTFTQIAGRRKHREAFVAAMSFANPGTVERLSWQDTAPGGAAVPPAAVTRYATTHVAGIRADDYVSEQVFFSSSDGTRVPMFLTHARDFTPDGTAPALVYFYGGFNIPLTPVFSPSFMTWVASYRGVLAFVNARGGGEYGDRWHEAGALFNKQNVFDDVHAACQWLHEHKYAKKGLITISGGSNGGLGVAAIANQCTDAAGIGAAIADVGVHDMLKFPLWTIGKAWTADYGNPQEYVCRVRRSRTRDPAALDYNLTYSPLHNVDPAKTYPTVVLACADHDDRVVPAHSFKLAAELQHRLPQNPNPLLLRVELQAGHGAGKSTQKRIEEASEKYAIVARMLGLQLYPASSL
ncbi:prolyl oligopeptidase [Malassezia sp. CBS 17886]|nr:prolyl oligopeptidase [Malassezia sp. CBS 17886]